MSFRVLGTGSYVPSHIVTNDEFSSFLDTTDEWITEHVGVKERHVCTTETASDLAYEAALRALENAGTKPEELDMILCSTVSSDDIAPSVSCFVQGRLGAACPAMDINAACSAFVYMLDTAAGFFMRRRVKKMLVIGAERMSRLLDWGDRNTCIIFGDGAGAMVLEEGDNYLASKLTAKGNEEIIRIPNFIGSSPFYRGEQLKPYVLMQGQETYKFAINAMAADIKDVVELAGMEQSDITFVIPHQANIRIIQVAQKRLQIPPERYYTNIERYGNTSSASIPIALDELNRSGRLRRGDILALSAFGGGLTSAACILKW